MAEPVLADQRLSISGTDPFMLEERTVHPWDVQYYRGMAEWNERKTNVELKNQLVQIAVKARLREYNPATEVRRFMAKMIGSAKARALAIPSAMAPKAALMTDPVAIEDLIYAAVLAMLFEMENGAWCQRDRRKAVRAVPAM